MHVQFAQIRKTIFDILIKAKFVFLDGDKFLKK